MILIKSWMEIFLETNSAEKVKRTEDGQLLQKEMSRLKTGLLLSVGKSVKQSLRQI